MAAASVQDAGSDDLNYETWAPTAKKTLEEKGLWDVVENGVPSDPSKIPELAATLQPKDLSKWRDLVVKDMKALQVLQSSLTGSAFKRTLSASSAKEVWDLLKKGNEEAKLRRLEKQFEELSMRESEPIAFYLGRVMEIVEQFRRLKNEKSDYQVITKLLSSLSRSYDHMVTTFKERLDLENTSLESLLDVFLRYEPVPEKSQCGEERDYARNHNQRRQQPEATGTQEDQYREVEADHLMLALTRGDFTFDEDMWMIYSTTTNHMTPYLKYFTTLDKTYTASVALANGSIIRAEGIGDVKIMTKEGDKTIKCVLFVPELDRNVLSVVQLTEIGYGVTTNLNKFTINDHTGRLFGETVREERGFFLRLQVVELPEYEMSALHIAPVTFDEDMWMIYTTTSNHMTPYLKYFTTLDRTYKARVTLADGSIIMAEGIGDVKIMTKEGKKAIKNVLFVPEINRNVLSVYQLTKMDYDVAMSLNKCTIKDQTGRLFGETIREERGFFLRLQVVGVPEYEMLALNVAPVRFDEDMWMICKTTSNHMTPYEKYFTTLDRTHRVLIKYITGSTVVSQGMGDVVIMTDKGKRTIENVLYVPGIDRNVLSLGQLVSRGYRVRIDAGKCTVKDQNKKVIGKTMWEERGFALRFQVIEGNLTS